MKKISPKKHRSLLHNKSQIVGPIVHRLESEIRTER